MPPNSILYFELELVEISDGTKIDVFSDMDTDRDGKLTGEIFWKHHILKIVLDDDIKIKVFRPMTVIGTSKWT